MAARALLRRYHSVRSIVDRTDAALWRCEGRSRVGELRLGWLFTSIRIFPSTYVMAHYYLLTAFTV